MNSQELIKRHEGTKKEGNKHVPYRDSEGILTIGYGYNLEKGITEYVANILFQDAMRDVMKDCLVFDWYPNLPPVRRAVVENMLYNLGLSRFMGFKKMIKAMESGDYDKAAEEMLDSKWARQVGYRADELATMMRSNSWAGI